MPVGGKVVVVCRTGRDSRSRWQQRMVRPRAFGLRAIIFHGRNRPVSGCWPVAAKTTMNTESTTVVITDDGKSTADDVTTAVEKWDEDEKGWTLYVTPDVWRSIEERRPATASRISHLKSGAPATHNE